MAGQQLLTVPELARRFGIGVRPIRGAIRRGELAAYHLGSESGWTRISEAEFLVWLRSRRLQTGPTASKRVAKRVDAQLRRESLLNTSTEA